MLRATTIRLVPTSRPNGWVLSCSALFMRYFYTSDWPSCARTNSSQNKSSKTSKRKSENRDDAEIFPLSRPPVNEHEPLPSINRGTPALGRADCIDDFRPGGAVEISESFGGSARAPQIARDQMVSA